MNETITVTVHGRKLTISKEVLEDLLEEKFQKGELIAALEKYAAKKANKVSHKVEVAKKPTVGKAFVVKPNGIDRNLFLEKRKNQKHEPIRQLINQAFGEVDKNPGKYSKEFLTMIPEKTWSVKSCAELEVFAKKNYGRIADWVQQALEWAQRIANGESWDDICVYPDTMEYRRIVLWKNGYYRRVGDTIASKTVNPPTYVEEKDLYSLNMLSEEVPLLALKAQCTV